MKKMLTLLIMMTAFAGASSAVAAKTDTIVIKTKIYCDHCKDCESCGTRLEEALMYTKGVKHMEINEEEMTITVVYKPKKVTPDEIRKVIAKAGYDADDVKADPEGYKKLDGCCKKKE